MFVFAFFYLINKIPFSYNLFMLLSLVMPLCKPAYTGAVDYFVSFPRYTLTLFPIYIAIYGLVYKSRKAFIFYLAASVFLLVNSVAFWCIGRFIA
ncbi:MAG: hypothetical protein N2376_06655 [Clostridia bacterium]|nr:hypothetical protein [Clostridia bacterium]